MHSCSLPQGRRRLGFCTRNVKWIRNCLHGKKTARCIQGRICELEMTASMLQQILLQVGLFNFYISDLITKWIVLGNCAHAWHKPGRND